MLFERPVGCLIFGRPEATKVSGWYGALEDTRRSPDDPKYCPLTYWQILNLARVYLDPRLQYDGEFAHPHRLVGPSVLPGFYDRRHIWHSAAASYVIDLALDRVPFDYLYFSVIGECKLTQRILLLIVVNTSTSS